MTLILAVVSLLTALAGLGTAVAVLRTALAALKTAEETKADVKVLNVQVNHRLDALLDTTAKSSRAEGVLEGKAEALKP